MFQNLLKYFPIYKYKISGRSMYPSLKPSQTILVNQFSFLIKSPKIGDVVALLDPRDGKTIIKRISEIKNNSAKQNAKYFVLGDNEKHSTDSRTFGWIRKKDIMGKIVFNKK